MSWTDDNSDNTQIWTFLVGATAGALVVGVIWLSIWQLDGADPAPAHDVAGASAANQLTSALSGQPSSGPDTVPLQRCQEVYDAQTAPLAAAKPSIEQWEVHIGAMNKLVVGQLTLKQATQFWNQTRVGAQRRLNHFADDRHAFGERTARCPRPQKGVKHSAELMKCYRAVAARHRALQRGTVALDTWQMHVHHMEMLRMGKMSPQEATQLWLQNWHQGNREVRAYRQAVRQTKGKDCCC
jgi:hypothetical protein